MHECIPQFSKLLEVLFIKKLEEDTKQKLQGSLNALWAIYSPFLLKISIRMQHGELLPPSF